MKKSIVSSLFAGILLIGMQEAFAQEKTKFPPLDASPMDVAYCPSNYVQANMKGNAEQLVARIFYSRPQKKGREIFGKLEPFGKVDRLGANEANELDIFKPVKIGGKQLQPGRYTLYAIFNPDKWTIVISSQTDTWGAYGYHPEKDIVRTDVPVQKLDTPLEALTMVFEKADKGANLVIAWDTTEVKLPVEF